MKQTAQAGKMGIGLRETVVLLTAAAALASMAPARAQSGNDIMKTDGFETVACAEEFPNGTVQNWTDLFLIWPGYGIRERLTVPYNGYLSFRFVASGINGQFGSVVTADFPGDGDGMGQMSISRTPGCFDASKLGVNCISTVSRFASVGWANGPTQFSCSLTIGQEYYVNLTYGGPDLGNGRPHCPNGSNSCKADVQNQVQF